MWGDGAIIQNEMVILRNRFSNCFKYNGLSFGSIDNKPERMTEFFGGIEAGGEYCGDNLKRRISCRQSSIIGKLKDIRNTLLREFSDADIEKKRTEAGSLWEPTGNRQPLSDLLMSDN